MPGHGTDQALPLTPPDSAVISWGDFPRNLSTDLFENLSLSPRNRKAAAATVRADPAGFLLLLLVEADVSHRARISWQTTSNSEILPQNPCDSSQFLYLATLNNLMYS